MGIPNHYSLELPQRCLCLVDELWPKVEMTFQSGNEHLGPLTTTFLFSMANPIVNLPIERIERQLSDKVDSYADDSELEPQLADAIRHVLGGREVQQAPFFKPDAWSFCQWMEPFNIAKGIPEYCQGHS